MALTDYTLGQLEGVAGVFKFTLRHSDASLTIPSTNPITSVGDLAERIDFAVGVNEIQNLTVHVREDYTTYAAGFWNKILNETIYAEDVELKVTLSEGGSDKMLFWGVIDRTNSKFEEHYLSGSSHKRTGQLVWVSLVYKLKQKSSADLITDVRSRDVLGTYNGNSWRFIKTKDVIASMMSITFGQSFDSNDVVVRNDTDILYTYSGTNYGFADTWVITNVGYFNSLDASYGLNNRYESCFDVLQMMMKNFGFVARWFYENGRHKLELLTRGRAYSTFLTFSGREKRSSPGVLFPIKPRNIRCIHSNSAETAQHWFVDGKLGGDHRLYNDPDPDKGYPPKFAELHMDVGMDWLLSWTDERQVFVHLYINTTGSTYQRVTAVDYYDYSTGLRGNLPKGTEALVKYYYNRFSPNRRTFRRTYGKMKATESGVESFTNLKLLKRTQIDDGLGNKNYYAQEVILRLVDNEVEVEWVQE